MDLNSLGIFGIYLASFALGMMHSLEPGHGKTVVAAYLVGSRGRNLDALILGLVVTFTHSFSIIILAVVAKFTSRYFSDQVLHTYLGIVASIIILGIGLWMLKTRWAVLRNTSRLLHNSSSDNPRIQKDHRHKHLHPDKDNTHRNIFISHNHDRQNSIHNHSNDKQLSLSGLILLGVSGGIVPCPAALAILLASASVGDISKGLALVIIFSIGLALSLVTIGLIVVNSVKIANRFTNTEKIAPKISFLSAGIVTMVGVLTLYSSIRHLGIA
ncbi:MAG: hypothetical protein A2Y97_01670 [Nitrospirae bacterium RBG_13_39_12]|nr:MAG: hypothetical protein A2Y97_01670 [Nitrospirae bacterium RBG_13_39_12]